MAEHACCVWDFTMPALTIDVDEVKAWCNRYCKSWVFQIEHGEIKDVPNDEVNCYIHYQGRVSLKLKSRMPPDGLWTAHWSPTSSANRDNDFYVTKEEGRMEGPWSDEDPEAIPMPRQYKFKTGEGYLNWQKDVLAINKKWDPRCINVIVDAKGNTGKTFLAMRGTVLGEARFLVYMSDYRDIMRTIMDTKKVRTYYMNISRALGRKNHADVYGALESIKDGYAYDDRYKYREAFFDSPNIWVFCNAMPDQEYLSKDRWKFWSIDEEGLVRLDDKGEPLTDGAPRSPDIVGEEDYDRVDPEGAHDEGQATMEGEEEVIMVED